jgi:hypothetical protein
MFKNEVIFNFVKFRATKRKWDNKFLSNSSIVAVVGSGMDKSQDPRSGINIMDPQLWYLRV